MANPRDWQSGPLRTDFEYATASAEFGKMDFDNYSEDGTIKL
jgi:hypothetical protein